jgi:uncharacterized protein YcbX
MSAVGKVDSLWRYPVKSMRGEELEEAFLGFSGVYGDRLFAFRSSASPKGFPYLTGREQEELLLYRPRLFWTCTVSEARSAPRFYPTAGGAQQWASLPRPTRVHNATITSATFAAKFERFPLSISQKCAARLLQEATKRSCSNEKSRP